MHWCEAVTSHTWQGPARQLSLNNNKSFVSDKEKENVKIVSFVPLKRFDDTKSLFVQLYLCKYFE